MNKQEILLECKKAEKKYLMAEQLLTEANGILYQAIEISDEDLEELSNDTDIKEMVIKIENLKEQLKDKVLEML